ncbi:MAG: site-specific integrase [Eubacterium sp.]|nr:site-specific integrase [Eubacterium sp.]
MENELLLNNSPNDILQYAIANSIIDVSSIAEEIKMNERKKYLSQHNYSIWQGNDGKWYTKLYDEVEGKKVLRKRKSEKEIEDVIVEHYKQLENEPIVSKVFEEWVSKKLEYKEISLSTAGRYRRDFNKYFDLDGFKDRKILYISEESIEGFIRKTIAINNLTTKAYTNFKTLILGIFKYAKRKKWTNLSITNVIGDLEISRRVFANRIVFKEKEIFYEDEVQKIVEYINKEYEQRGVFIDIKRLGILLTFQTGLRVGELCSIKWSDIDFYRKYIHIQRTEVEYPDEDGKFIIAIKDYPKSSSGDRYVYITDRTLETLNKIKEVNPNPVDNFLFCKMNGSRKFSRVYGRNFNPELKKICDEVGIPVRTMHKIRKTYGTTLIDAGVDESFIIEQMGHADISCTKKYYYFSNKKTDKKLQQINNAILI